MGTQLSYLYSGFTCRAINTKKLGLRLQRMRSQQHIYHRTVQTFKDDDDDDDDVKGQFIG